MVSQINNLTPFSHVFPHLSSRTCPEISAQLFIVGTGSAADPETMYLAKQSAEVGLSESHSLQN